MPGLVSLSSLASSSTTPTLLKTQATICSKSNTTFQTHLPELTRLQEEVKRAVQVRQQEEDWDEVTRNAVSAWTEDIESIWRSYRKMFYDAEKALPLILDSLKTILDQDLLNLAIPSQTYPPPASSPPLLTVLPPSTYTDPTGRPIAVLSLRSLRKEPSKEGKEKIKLWAWWCAEIVRRCLREVDLERQGDEDGEQRRGTGCVMIVDFKSAGFKNIDLDLVPHLLSILQTTYPGLFSTIYIINQSWTHASLWQLVKRLVPKTALDRVRFLEKGEIEQVLDLKMIPQSLGGKADWDLVQNGHWAMDAYSYQDWNVYSSKTSETGTKQENDDDDEGDFRMRSRSNVMVDVVAPTPVIQSSEDEDDEDDDDGMSDSDEDEKTNRLKGFELYLSPSRVRGTSFDSSFSSISGGPGPINPSLGSISERGRGSGSMERHRGRLSFDLVSERSYSASLQEHHSRRLSESRIAVEKVRAREMILREIARGGESGMLDGVVTSGKKFTIGPGPKVKQETKPVEPEKKTGLPISAYDRMRNPMFGYPAVSVTGSLQEHQPAAVNNQNNNQNKAQQGIVYLSTDHNTVIPMHGRRRKRDLVKTLCLLGILRVVGIRNWLVSLASEIGRLFWGLLFLRRWFSSMRMDDRADRGRSGIYARGRRDVPLTPNSGLTQEFNLGPNETVRRGSSLISKDDWIWLFMSLMVVRDGWARAFLNLWETSRKGVKFVIGR